VRTIGSDGRVRVHRCAIIDKGMNSMMFLRVTDDNEVAELDRPHDRRAQSVGPSWRQPPAVHAASLGGLWGRRRGGPSGEGVGARGGPRCFLLQEKGTTYCQNQC